MKKTLVTCYVNPDLDGFACAIAYSELLTKLGRKAIPAIIGEPHDEAKYIMKTFGFEYPKTVQNIRDYNKIILVDSSDLNGIDKRINPKNVIEIIDHRKINEAHAFTNAKIQIELVGAAATLIAEKFKNYKVKISRASATLLYGAIISNTLDFKAKVTTNRDKKVANWLNKKLRLPKNFAKQMFLAKSKISQENIESRIRGDFAWFNIANKRIGIAQLEIVESTKLVTNYKNIIIECLNKLKSEHNLDLIFLSIIELEEGFNFFITKDITTKNILENIFKINFIEDIAKRDDLIMRKEIVPLIKERLENEKTLKEFIKYISIPLIFLIIAILFILLYKLLGLPSPEKIIELAQKYYLKYGYWVVFFGALIEGLLFVNWYLPGSIIMVLGVLFAKQNSQNIFLVIFLIMLGFLITSILNYLLGKYGWYQIFLKLGLKQPLENIKKKVENKGLQIIFLTYFHPNVGALTATSAGILKLDFKKFLLYSILAITIWNTLWAFLVYFSGPLIIKLLSQRLLIPILIIWLIYLTIRYIKHKPAPPVP